MPLGAFTPRRLFGIALALAVGAAAILRAQPATPPDVLLERRVTPGTIALLIEHAGSPQVRDRTRDTLTHHNPRVRAAAARVAFVTGAPGLLPDIAAALEIEADPGAAAELAGSILYFAGPQHDGRVLDAYERTGHLTILQRLATARGVDALSAVPRLQALGISRQHLGAFLERAVALEPARLVPLAHAAAGGDDAVLLAAVLGTGRRLQIELPETVLTAAMRDEASDEMHEQALWHLAESGALAGAPAEGTLRDAIGRTAERLSGAESTPRQLGLAILAARALGEPESAGDRWTALVKEPPDPLRGLLRLNTVQPLLTDAERTLANARPDRPPLPEPSAPTAPSSFRTVTGYPAGFMASVFQETGCRVEAVQRAGIAGAVAEVSWLPDGRVSRVQLGKSSMPDPCRYAVRVLMRTYVHDTGRRGAPSPLQLTVPFVPEFVACDHSANPGWPFRSEDVTPHVHPPMRAGGERVAYPVEALRDGARGTVGIEGVIAAQGCVASAEVVAGAGTQLDWAALRNVATWTFMPMLLDGVPHPLPLRVTVRFNAATR